MEKAFKYDPREIVKASAKNSVGGEDRFLKGAVTERGPVETWPKEWRDEYHVASYFDEPSNKLLKDQIIAPLKELSAKHSIDYWFGGDTFPFHVTLGSGLKKNEDDTMLTGTQATQEAYQPLVSNLAINAAMNELNGMNIVFSDLLLAGDNIILNAREIPDQIVYVRDVITDMEQRAHITPKVPTNIFHITIGRIKSAGNDEERTAFRTEFRNLKRSIRDNPLPLTLHGSFNGRNMMERAEDE